MDFEELKVIWDTQSKQPLYAIDQAALRNRVIRKSRSVKLCLEFFEWSGMLALSGVAIASITEPLFEGHDWHQLFTGTLLLIGAAFIGLNRMQRRKSEMRFDQSLLGILEKSIARLEGHIRRLGSMFYWIGIPYLITIAVSFYFQHSGKPAWFWVAAMLWPFLAYWGVRREIRKGFLPRLRDFKSLRDKLAKPETPVSTES
jgi:hypothetical protein